MTDERPARRNEMRRADDERLVELDRKLSGLALRLALVERDVKIIPDLDTKLDNITLAMAAYSIADLNKAVRELQTKSDQMTGAYRLVQVIQVLLVIVVSGLAILTAVSKT